MSRIGKQPIIIPDGVTIKVTDGSIWVKGSKGELSCRIPPEMQVRQDNKDLQVIPLLKTGKTSALWGLIRSLIANMVRGVVSGYEKKLEMEGIGFRAVLEGDTLVLQLGFSHSVRFPAPAGIKFLVEKNVITISGIDKALVGETAARIRGLKPPEPYKGKGIHYRGEVIRRKAGKKAVASA